MRVEDEARAQIERNKLHCGLGPKREFAKLCTTCMHGHISRHFKEHHGKHRKLKTVLSFKNGKIFNCFSHSIDRVHRSHDTIRNRQEKSMSW